MQQPSHPTADPSRDAASSDIQVNIALLEQSHSPVNPTQLRKQATGALINLFPHNIRYDELVREGVDPDVLKGLYDEIGVKIAIPSPHPAVNVQRTTPPLLDTTSLAPSHLDKSSASAPSKILNGLPKAQPIQQITSASSQIVAEVAKMADTPASRSVQQARGPDSANLAVDKPAGRAVERTEYLARLLAARSGKPVTVTSQAASSPTAPKPDLSTMPTPLPAQDLAPSGGEKPTNAADVPVREKSKAQTELARQKMEQLKQQVLLSKAVSHRSFVDGPGAPLTSASQPTLSQDRQQHSSDLGPDESPSPVLLSPNITNPQVSRAQPEASSQNTQSRPIDTSKRAAFQIPGLFMTGPEQPSLQTALPPSVSSPFMTHTEPNQQPITRKRLVASDLNDEPGVTSKRPFGQSRMSQVVIDISDDEISYGHEDEGSDMDVDESVDEQDQEVGFGRRESKHHQTLRDLPSFTDPSGRKVSIPLANLMTPPVASTPQTPGTGKEREDLRRRDQEIEEMKRKIKELESRRKAKQQSSRTQTPAASSVPSVPPDAPQGIQTMVTGLAPRNTEEPLAQKLKPGPDVHSNVAAPTSLSSVVPDPPAVIQNHSLNQSVHSDRSSPVVSSPQVRQLDPAKARELEMKRKRKAELESGLPILDAEVERTRSKLDQMRREMIRMEEDIRRGLEGRQALVQELEALGIDTEGVSTNELQAKMNQIVDEQNGLQANESG
jgi:hypothetical protein